MQRMSRRRFLAVGGGWVALFLAACRPKLGPTTTTPPATTTGLAGAVAYRLDPNYSADPVACPGGTCIACAACRAHAANRILPSAEPVRAHPGCKCLVVPDPSITPETYGALFANSNNPTGGPVDRRWPWVSAVLGG
ncbi:MAG: hypothetical protein WD770_05520 [Actinomycetota bacterium]